MGFVVVGGCFYFVVVGSICSSHSFFMSDNASIWRNNPVYRFFSFSLRNDISLSVVSLLKCWKPCEAKSNPNSLLFSIGGSIVVTLIS